MGIRGRAIGYGVITYFDAPEQRGHHLFSLQAIRGYALFGDSDPTGSRLIFGTGYTGSQHIFMP